MNPKHYYTDAFKEQRLELIEKLRKQGISDEAVLAAMSRLPREKFINKAYINRAYDNHALPIDCDQTISQPYTVAYMTSALNVAADDKILEIGSGSGYQSALLFLMGAKVFTIERVQELFERAQKIFSELKMNINIRYGDGTLGWKRFAPYKGIIVTAAAPAPPKTLLKQLSIGGKLVVPVGGRHTQTMYIIERLNEKDYKEYKTDSFKFVPLIGKEGFEG